MLVKLLDAILRINISIHIINAIRILILLLTFFIKSVMHQEKAIDLTYEQATEIY